MDHEEGAFDFIMGVLLQIENDDLANKMSRCYLSIL